jgi:peptidoglycan/LPS O-acetylase OafA/YrhL
MDDEANTGRIAKESSSVPPGSMVRGPGLGTYHPKYRPDIDGLRAIAVLSVVLFHAFPSNIRGGFIGVDIFFAISGYLISKIIFENLDRGTFSFADFYQRRIRRIFPSLIVTLLAAAVIAAIVLDVVTLRQFGRDMSAAAAFLSNFVLWHQSGYFDDSATAKPLLHLWSLAIEEQFYIVWPLLLWVIWRLRPAFRLSLIVGLAVASFAWNVFESGRNPVADFYSPATRFFELMIGALLAYSMKNRKEPTSPLYSNCLSWGGTAAIAAGLVLIDHDSIFPGWWALLPTVGATLLMGASASAFVNRIVLANRVLVWFGLISYPLYLWHWILLTFARIQNYDDRLPRDLRWAIVLGSVALAWLTYRLVEKPLRFEPHGRMKAYALAIAMVLMFAGGVGTSVFTPRLTPTQAKLVQQLAGVASLKDHVAAMYGDRLCFKYEIDQTADFFTENGCTTVRNPARPTVFLIGDSFSASFSLGLRPLFEARDINFLQVSTGWCEPTSDEKKNKVCHDINAMVQERIGAIKPDLVIFNANWIVASHRPYYRGSDYFATLSEYLRMVRDRGAREIIVVGQAPTWRKALPDLLIRDFVVRGEPIPQRTTQGLVPESLAIDTEMASLRYPDGTSYLSIAKVLCNEAGCLTATSEDLENDLTAWDYGHLTPSVARHVAEALFSSVVARIEKARPAATSSQQ